MVSTRRFLTAAVPVLAIAAAAAAVPAQSTQVTVDAAAVTGLETRLQAFAATLPPAQREALDGLLRDAAGAPADNPMGTTVRPVFFTPGGRSGIIVQGGRTGIIVEGGRAAAPVRAGTVRPGGVEAIGPKQDDPRAPRPTGAVAIGPKQDDPRAPGTGAVAIGPKQDDPGAPRPTGVVSIGPKQDDPRAPQAALSARLAELSGTLPEQQRAVLDWLIQRASASSARGTHGTPGGLPPGRAPSLSQALGITPLAIGPKQDDPAPPPPSNTRWVLKF